MTRWWFRKKDQKANVVTDYKYGLRPPRLVILAINHQEGTYYWHREHPEFPTQRVSIVTGSQATHHGFHFQKDDIIMAVGRYHEIPNLQEVLDTLRMCYVGEWPREELHLR